jgi:gas vesicle protein
MRAITCAAAVLMVAFSTGCKDRDRTDTASRIDNAAGETGDEVREETDNAGDEVADAADDVGDAAREGAKDVGNAAKDVADDPTDDSFADRDEFKRDVRERLDRMDQELTELGRDVSGDANDARVKAIAAARDARQAVERSYAKLAGATASTWGDLRREVSDALDSAERQVQALRPDAKPMGGTGGPS